MRNSTEADTFASLVEIAPLGARTCIDTPMVISRRAIAGNDEYGDDAIAAADDIDAWARHALAANGFADADAVAIERSGQPTSYALHRAARARRAAMVGEKIARGLAAAWTLVRRTYASHQRRRHERIACAELYQLDDRTLHDLGLDRSEITSVVAELRDDTEYARLRTRRYSHLARCTKPLAR